MVRCKADGHLAMVTVSDDRPPPVSCQPLLADGHHRLLKFWYSRYPAGLAALQAAPGPLSPTAAAMAAHVAPPARNALICRARSACRASRSARVASRAVSWAACAAAWRSAWAACRAACQAAGMGDRPVVP